MKRFPHNRLGGLLPACTLHEAADSLAGTVVLLAAGVLCAAYFLPLTHIDTILAASLADGPTAGYAEFVGADSGASEYEANGDGTAARQALETQLVGTALSNHDSDGDGLIQITTAEQLNAVRYDLDGDGTVEDDDNTEDVDEAALYSAAFPVASDGSPCPSGTSCTGYELMNDLDLDTDGDGTADDGDTYWNDGAGWQPIGALNTGFRGHLRWQRPEHQQPVHRPEHRGPYRPVWSSWRRRRNQERPP